MRSQGLTPIANLLGATDLWVSRIGFGCYRVHEFEPEHRLALQNALLSGCNLIDTSGNYMDGSSERLVGDVLNDLIETGRLQREEVVVVTKAGYVQGENLREAKERAATRLAFPDMVEFQADCWHNISPEYLEHQITKSLERLRLSCLDVLLLHNPEYFLKASGTREVYYQRIENAFRHLESEREKGRIRFYGISSNTFPEPESRSTFTSLAKTVEIANNLHEKNHFAVVQCPFNLFESGAALLKNNQAKNDANKGNERKTFLEFAAEKGLGVLTNRPFNASQQGRLVRLTSFPTHDEIEIKGHLHTVLGKAIELEKRLPDYPRSPQGLLWAHVLRDRLGELDDVLAWKEVLYNQIFPSTRQALKRLPETFQGWAETYQTALQELVRLITADLENLAERKSKLISDQMNALAPELSSSASLSRKMLRLYLGLPEISSVLVGMRSPSYVQDTLAWESPLPKPDALSVLEKSQRHRS